MATDTLLIAEQFIRTPAAQVLVTPTGLPQVALGAQLANPTFQTVTLAPNGLLYESAADNLTAAAGGGQAGALPLAAETNRIATVAAAGDSVKLPASAPGLTIIVINHGANSCQVYGLGADTINDAATATGVPQMMNSEVIYTCTTAGKWYSNGLGTGYAGPLPTVSFQNGITATAGGGQAGAFQINTCIARLTTVAANGDSAKLPASAGGLQITVSNAGAASLNVFPYLGDAINGAAANAAFAVAAGKTASFSCAVAGQWHALASA